MENSTQENVVLSQNQPILPEQPKQNNFLVILLSTLLLLSVLIAGFFAYQTQMLVKELTSIKTTSTPVSIEESKEDLTADWKTYTDKKFTIKYPSNVMINFKTQGNEEIFEIKGLDEDILLVVDPIAERNFYLGKKVSKQIKYNNVSWNLLVGDEQYCDGGECSKISDALQVEYQNKRYTIVLGDLSYSNLEFDQILSTFKFVD